MKQRYQSGSQAVEGKPSSRREAKQSGSQASEVVKRSEVRQSHIEAVKHVLGWVAQAKSSWGAAIRSSEVKWSSEVVKRSGQAKRSSEVKFLSLTSRL